MTFPTSAKKSIACVPLVLALASGGLQAARGPNLPPNLNGIGIEQRLNAQIPLETTFRDESGASVQLRSFFGNKPVVLAPVYYRCPMLCSQI